MEPIIIVENENRFEFINLDNSIIKDIFTVYMEFPFSNPMPNKVAQVKQLLLQEKVNIFDFFGIANATFNNKNYYSLYK